MEEDKLSKFKMVVVGGSAGSLNVVLNLLSSCSDCVNISFVIILHRKNNNDSLLEKLLSTKTKLPVKEVEDKETIEPGRLYIAPPDYHLLFENETNFSLDVSEKVQFSRPSIDVTFESASEIFGDSLIGILLSGANNDGTFGIKKIKERGGFTIVQDPASADSPYMPQQAIKKTKVDKIIAGDKIGKFLMELIK